MRNWPPSTPTPTNWACWRCGCSLATMTPKPQHLPATTPSMLRQIITDTLTNPPQQRPLPEAWTYVWPRHRRRPTPPENRSRGRASRRRTRTPVGTHRALQTNGTKRSFNATVQPAAVQTAAVQTANVHRATTAPPEAAHCPNSVSGRRGDRGVCWLAAIVRQLPTEGIEYPIHCADVLSRLFLPFIPLTVPPTPRPPTARLTRPEPDHHQPSATPGSLRGDRQRGERRMGLGPVQCLQR